MFHVGISQRSSGPSGTATGEEKEEEKKENKRPALDIFFSLLLPSFPIAPRSEVGGGGKRNPAILCNRGGWASVGRIPSAGYM